MQSKQYHTTFLKESCGNESFQCQFEPTHPTVSWYYGGIFRPIPKYLDCAGNVTKAHEQHAVWTTSCPKMPDWKCNGKCNDKYWNKAPYGTWERWKYN